MNKFKVGDVAMYRYNKLVHIVGVHVTDPKHSNLFGELEPNYRYVVEENGDNLQKLVWESELVEIKNIDSYLIIPRKDNINYAPARTLSTMIIDYIPKLSKLSADAYYECEDKLTEFINEYKKERK